MAALGALPALCCCVSLHAAALDPSKLPPSATNQIDFARDIKPILEESCLRCHGPEKPKSGFRLDNRASALKGGENGVDIRPGDGARSPLVHYAAYLVPDMEMPPVGKGRQLTPAEVGKLRAWIDQGAVWETVTPTNLLTLEIDPTGSDTKVHGDKHKFEEQYWRKAGPDGGVEYFELTEQPNVDTKVSITGHATLDDYKVVLSLDRNDLGFVHSGWEQYRKWYDDTGGYLPAASPQAPHLGRDLHLDIGKAWIDAGLALPNWPLMVLGYELDYKRGDEAIASWGNFGSGVNARNLAPASEAIHEGVHIIKFDLDDEIKGMVIEERFRAEFYRLDTQSTNQAARNLVSNSTIENDHYFSGANTIRLEKQFTSWLFGSAGYLFSKLDAGGNFTDSVTLSPTLYFSQVPQITLERESDVVNLNALIGPFDGLSISAGGQAEWDRQNGLGSGNLNEIPFTFGPAADLTVNAATVSSDYNENSVSESLGLRYTKIPFTVLFAEARAKQDRMGQTESDIQPSGSYFDNTTYTSQLEDIRAGFNTSPWRMVSLSAHYRRSEEDDRFQTNGVTLPAGGYPGLLQERYTLTDEAEAKLALHPCAWLKTALTYQYLVTDYREKTGEAITTVPPVLVLPGGELLAGRYRAQVGSINATVTPCSRLSLSATVSYQPTTISTASAGSPSIVPYRGYVCSVLGSGTYIINPATEAFLSYAFSEANYAQNDFANGLPVGIEYQQHAAQVGISHRFTKNFSAKLQYGTYYYSEPSSGRSDNFVAHAIFATLSFRLH